jgi:quercetin dioxygenase-like cupin family protein
MPIYTTMGSIPRKRHIAFRKPDGGIYAEELMGHEGFTGTSSLLYHVHPPTTVKSVRRVKELKFEADPDQTLRHRHFRTSQVKKGGSPTLDRTPLLFNQDIAMLYVEPDENDAHFYRNAQADELVYVAKGKGVLETVFGDLPYGEGDYLVIHRGILHRYKMDLGAEPTKMLVMESRGHVRWPKRYRNEFGQLIEGAPYSERDIRRPTQLRTHDEMGDFPILVKQYDGLNEITLDHHPLDVVGWDGYFYPWAFNIMDFEPIVGRVHQPPPGAPDLPGRRLRGLQLLPPALRFPSRGDPRAVQPQQRGLGRGALLRVERVHEPEGDRVREHHPSPGRDSARPAPRPRGGEHRCQVHRRAGGHDGQLPAAQGGQAGTVDRGQEVPHVVARRAARAVQPAHQLR